jgi:hypothetical protein
MNQFQAGFTNKTLSGHMYDGEVRDHCPVQGDAGHPGNQGGRQENNNWKKGAGEEERTSGSQTPKNFVRVNYVYV